MSECIGQERLRDLRNDEREALGRAQTPNWRKYQSEQRKGPRKLGLGTESTSVQLCGDSNVAKPRINGHFAMGQVQGEIEASSEDIAFVVDEKEVFPGRSIDDNVKHIFREHNQEADDLVNLVNEGQRKITIEGVKNTEDWKAVRGY